MKRERRRVVVFAFAFAAAVGCWSCAHRPVDRIGQDVVRASNEAAFHSGSTSPPYAMIRIVDGDGRAPRVVCVDPHFVVGALMRERGVNETAAIAFALDPPEGAIRLERGAADLGRDGAMTEADLAQARKALQPYSDRALRVAYSRSGAASDAGRAIP